MNKKLLIIAGIIIAAIAGLTIFVLSGGGGGDKGNLTRLPDHSFEDWSKNITNSQAVTNEALDLFDSTVLSYDKIMEMAKTGRISLVSELWRLRRKCPALQKQYADKMTADEKEKARDEWYRCNLLIQKFLMAKFKKPGNEHLANIFMKYVRYEGIMREFQMPKDISREERYKLIKEKRREIMGNADAQLVFGLEETKVSYNGTLKNFMKDTRGMSGDERMKAYPDMRKKAYGDYYDAMVEKEPRFSTYNMEMTLRNNDLTAMKGEARTQYVRGMRERYFGKAGADRMAKVDQQIAQEKDTIEKYKAAESKFLTENASLSDADKETKLRAMRVKFMGSAAAAAYERRMKYEDYMRKKRAEKK